MAPDIETRLQRDAARWRGGQAADPPLSDFLSAASLSGGPRVSPRLRSGLAITAACAVVAGASLLITLWPTTHDSPSRQAHGAPAVPAAPPTATPAATLTTCGTLSALKARPSHDPVSFTLSAPSSGITGTAVTVTLTARATTGTLAVPDLTPNVVVLRGDDVVGEVGGIAGVAHGGTLTSSPTDIAATVYLRGCPDLDNPDQSAVASRRPLPPGTYTLIAQVLDGGGRNPTSWLSNPVTIHIRAS